MRYSFLVLAKQRGFVKCVKLDSDRLRMNGYRNSDEVYIQILAKAGEK